MHLSWTLTAFAEDYAFECPTVSVPADARDMANKYPKAALDTAWDEIAVWLDTSCVGPCVVMDGGEVACEEADCTTAAGAVIKYRLAAYDLSGGTTSIVTSDLTLSVTPPEDADLTWTSADYTHYSYLEYGDTSTQSEHSGSIAWAGTLLPEWPLDASFSAGEFSQSWESWMYSGWSSSDYFTSDSCAWRTSSSDSTSLYDSGTVTVAIYGQPDVSVFSAGLPIDPYNCHGTYAFASLDGSVVGDVYEDTWELLPDSDGDGNSDGFDCAPDDPTIRPCAIDIACDGIDQDCTGDDNLNCDNDGDGYGISSDCNDRVASIHLGADDLCDGIDQDCDGHDDCDVDADGYDAIVDCDDADATVNPDAEELCGDDIDQNCDGYFECDHDGDGWSTPADCNDHCARCFPGADDEPCDDLDQDCDGVDPCDTAAPDDTLDREPPDAGRTGCATGGPSTAGTASLLAALILRRRSAPRPASHAARC